MTCRKPTLVPYALTSRNWQYAVEMHTFSSPRVNSNELTAFARPYGGEPGTSHRRSALRKIGFKLQRSTPRPDKQRLTSQGQELETREDNAAFQNGFKNLFEILNSWNQEISIVLEVFTQLIYEPEITSPECIPMTSCINELVIKRGYASPKTVVCLARWIQGLCEFGAQVDENEPTVNSVLRRKELFGKSLYYSSTQSASVSSWSFIIWVMADAHEQQIRCGLRNNALSSSIWRLERPIAYHGMMIWNRHRVQISRGSIGPYQNGGK